MYTLLQDEHFWIYTALFLFVIMFGKLIYKQLRSFFNHQIDLVKTTISETKKPLDESLKALKTQKQHLQLLNDKIQKIKKKDKEMGDVIVESFYESLNLKIHHIEEEFNVFLKNDRQNAFNQLTHQLIQDSYNITTKLLQNNLTLNAKQQMLEDSIVNLDQALSKKFSSYEH